MSIKILLRGFLDGRLDEPALAWLDAACDEIEAGADDTRFGSLISLAARKLGHAAKRTWTLDATELDAAWTLVEGWNPERWTTLEAGRVVLVMARPDLLKPSAPVAIEAAFRFADEGELCALYRCLAFLPNPEAYFWRAAEGCRTNMASVFMADVLDTPYPALNFDAVAFNQAVIKALFIDVPLWRLWSLDRRLSPELARMALDLVDERRSARRPVQPELWLCLGSFGGERGLEALEAELAPALADPTTIGASPEHPAHVGARAATLALGRAGQSERLKELLASGPDFLHGEAREALAGDANQTAWQRFREPASTQTQA